MNGYDTNTYSRGDAKAGKPISRMRYFVVYKDGADKPSDLVREQPSGKLISIIDTVKERQIDAELSRRMHERLFGNDTIPETGSPTVPSDRAL